MQAYNITNMKNTKQIEQLYTNNISYSRSVMDLEW